MTMRYERERRSSVRTVLVTILFAVVAVGMTAAVVAPGVVVGQSPSPPGPLDGILSDPVDEDAPPEGPAGAGGEDATGRAGSLETDNGSDGSDVDESDAGDREANEDDGGEAEENEPLFER